MFVHVPRVLDKTPRSLLPSGSERIGRDPNMGRDGPRMGRDGTPSEQCLVA